MRLIVFIIWVVLGFCLLLSGCRATISAGRLEASFALGFPGVTTPEIQEVVHDEVSERS